MSIKRILIKSATLPPELIYRLLRAVVDVVIAILDRRKR